MIYYAQDNSIAWKQVAYHKRVYIHFEKLIMKIEVSIILKTFLGLQARVIYLWE